MPPDFGAPIAQNVDVSADRGIQTLSDLMGLQQRQIGIEQAKQTLQTGQAIQARAQAEAQGQQQQMQERQLLQTSMKSGQAPDGTSLLGPDGEADPVAMTKFATKYLPAIGQGVVQNIVKTQDDRLKLNDTTRQLGQNYRNDLSGIVRSSIGTDDDTAAKIDAYVQQQGPQAPAALVQAAAHTKSLLQNLGPQVPDDHRDRALLHLAQQFQPTAATAGEQAPSIGQVTGPGGGAQLIQTNPLAPIPTGPVGREIRTGVPPGVVASPAGPLVRTGGGGTTITPLTTTGPPAAAPTNLNITRAQQENVTGMAGDDRSRYAQISQEGTNARTGAQLADQVADLSEQVRTGQLTQEWANRLATLRQHDPNITARQMLTKYAAQLKTMATSGATTDASRSQIDEGMPSPETMDPDAVKQAAQYVGGIFRQRQARQAYADQYVKNNGGSSLGIRGPDDEFMRSGDPTVFAYEALPPGQPRQDFLRAHGLTTPERQAAFQAQRNQVKHYGVQ